MSYQHLMRLRTYGAPLALALAIAVAPVATLAGVGDGATPTPSPTATSTPQPVDPAITARATEWLHRFQTGDVDRSQMTAEAIAAYTNPYLQQLNSWAKLLGDPIEPLRFTGRDVGAKITIYMYAVTYASNKTAIWDFAMTDGKVAYMQLLPGQPLSF
jgi:hypothetical protein